MSDKKPVELVQGIWCDPGRHVIPKACLYRTLDDGRSACPDHEDAPMLETQLAGSLR